MNYKDIEKEEYFIKDRSLKKIRGKIKFFDNFDLSSLTDDEILDKYMKFNVKYNGLEDMKLDGGIGIEIENPGFLSGKVTLTDKKKKEYSERYKKELIQMLEASEDESKVRKIVEITEL